jgi:IstB-like ATP binding protein
VSRPSPQQNRFKASKPTQENPGNRSSRKNRKTRRWTKRGGGGAKKSLQGQGHPGGSAVRHTTRYRVVVFPTENCRPCPPHTTGPTFWVTSRIMPFEKWTEVLRSERLIVSALDRLTHRCHIQETNDESFRPRRYALCCSTRVKGDCCEKRSGLLNKSAFWQERWLGSWCRRRFRDCVISQHHSAATNRFRF